MATAIDKSQKLIFNEFQKSISEVPLEVYYQIVQSTQYNQAGFQFNIKQPGTRALLDTDVWIKYTIPMREMANFALRNTLCNPAAGVAPEAIYPVPSGAGGAGAAGPPIVASGINPATAAAEGKRKYCLRSGYCVWRCLQNFSIQINNQTITTQPQKYIDILNRLYVSNQQSTHEFSTSGGAFDSGNHGARTMYTNAATNQWYFSNSQDQMPTGHDADFKLNDEAAFGNTKIFGYLAEGFYPLQPSFYPARNIYCRMFRPAPNHYEFLNPGLERRQNEFIRMLRDISTGAANSDRWLAANNAGQINDFDSGQNAAANQNYWLIEIYERLPITLFKMYNNDGVFGVIPNINQMTIQGNFASNMPELFFRSNDPAATQLGFYWTAVAAGAQCQLYLKWYTPPMNMMLPRELAFPFPKINVWSKNYGLNTALAANLKSASNSNVNEYNVTLESIPDLLLIYMKIEPSTYTMNLPDDMLLEITSLMINIDNASGKMNQMTTLDLYNKWKKILKHQDNEIISFNEWRKYCCVAALQPEDYGVRYGPGYSNQTVLGIKMDVTNWWNNPAIWLTNNEFYDAEDWSLHVISIYNRNQLIIRSDGTAQQEMVKVAADFNMVGSVAEISDVMESRGRLNL